jgi:2-succinyl-6-hydroxy-2,4-cyclohexadiene-1-carboxylate synthase
VDAFLAWWLGQPMFAGLPDDPDDRAARATNTPAGLASSLRRCGTGVQEPLWHRLGEITVPTLVLAGEHDTKFAAIAERMAAHLGGPTRRELVPGAGHAAHLENPTAFLALLTTWLEDAVRGEPR